MRKMIAWLGAVFSVAIMGHAGAAPVELDQVQPRTDRSRKTKPLFCALISPLMRLPFWRKATA